MNGKSLTKEPCSDTTWWDKGLFLIFWWVWINSIWGGFDVGCPTTMTTRLLRLSNRYTGSDCDVLAVPRTPWTCKQPRTSKNKMNKQIGWSSRHTRLQGRSSSYLASKQNPPSFWWLLVLFIRRRAQGGVGNPNLGVPQWALVSTRPRPSCSSVHPFACCAQLR